MQLYLIINNLHHSIFHPLLTRLSLSNEGSQREKGMRKVLRVKERENGKVSKRDRREEREIYQVATDHPQTWAFFGFTER